MRVAFTLTGETPLLMHANDIEAADTLMEWRKDPANKNLSVAGDDRSPAWTWQTYLYSDGAGIVMPAQNIMVALRQAGAKVILKGQTTFKQITQSGLLIADEYCEFLCGGRAIIVEQIADMRDEPFAKQAEKCLALGFRLFAKRATIGKSMHVRVRPRFESWSVSGAIEVMAPEITYEKLELIFSMAGRCGLGDWRPACKTPGPYGMFSVKLKKL